jgi:ethanolamine kinase
MNDINNTLYPDQALDFVTRIFRKEWILLKPEEIKVAQLSTGYSNTVWLITRNEAHGQKEPTRLILRVCGGKIMRQKIERFRDTSFSEEVLVYNEVNKYGCGPKVYGIFSKSILMEYVDCVELTPSIASNSDVMQAIAKAMANFHLIDLPFDRRGFNIIKKTKEVIDETHFETTSYWKTIRDSMMTSVKNIRDVDDFLDWDIAKELDEGTRIQQKVKSRIVMSHGDSNILNKLLTKSGSPEQLRVLFCDFEFSCYGERAFDIGGHFYHISEKSGRDKIFAGEHVKLEFVKHYLQESQRLCYIKDLDQTTDSIEKLMLELDYGILLYYLFILGWMRYTFSSFVLEYPHFVDETKDLIAGYYKYKETFLRKHGQNL